ncbi:VPS10 domain-containing protein [Paenibacillus segetis]|uniref:Sortilin N-terminal domain-containing protein n=1 Tax=Paenibacillus segetis TaxID=1325360 RepID=A0ABQ1YDH1_9BACL|nr:hypothetical protein [Paenibacillus segetis]GGH22153.1 hypothetical protein GCM10008013_20460 [Paenibacillus segetis]
MKWCSKITAAILVTCILLTGCSSEEPQVASSVPNEITEEGQTLTIINPPDTTTNNAVMNLSITDKYQIKTRLTDFQLLNETTGLAWGTTKGELRLYRTEDSGETWTNISPADAVQFPSNPVYGKEIFFIDLLNGWIVRNSTGSSNPIVLRTRDGGETWKLSSLKEADQVASIYFTDQAHGWILAVDNSTSDSEEKTLYQTENGGATWSNIMSTQLSPNKNSSVHSIPKFGNFVSMTFMNENEGFISTLKAGQPALYVTYDGGMDWDENTTFFNPKKYESCDRFEVGEITSFTNDKSTGWIPIGCSREDATKFNGYFTHDSGESWTLSPFQLSWQSGLNENSTPTFLNTKEGWALQDTTVFHTIDQGQSWTALPESAKLKDILKDYPEVVNFRFISSNVGWLLVAKMDQKRSLLLQTKNGGVSWRVL